MKIKFLKNHNGWGKGSVVKALSELSRQWINNGIAEETDETAPEIKLPYSEEPVTEKADEPEIKEEPKEVKKETVNKSKLKIF